jgi:hypothetical protein
MLRGKATKRAVVLAYSLPTLPQRYMRRDIAVGIEV